ncbi:MAG: carbohydrate ABC transporter permease [Anaerolineales bacterium]|nr:MAG: carbohydrate ABC transporter permease [Anaerolineales bacterium]
MQTTSQLHRTPLQTLLQRYKQWRITSGIDWSTYLIRLVIIIITMAFFGLPMIWLFLATTKTNAQLMDLPPISIGSLSYVKTAWEHLLTYNSGVILRWISNSVWYVVTGLLLNLVITIPAGYALSVIKFKGRAAILWLTLIMRVIPAGVLVLPMFLELHALGMINTPWSLIVPAGFNAAGVYLVFVFYKSAMPRDLIDAARVDGCNEWQLFWSIGLPLAKSVIAILLFLTFGGLWNNFFGAQMFIYKDNLRTLPVGTGILISQVGAVRPDSGSLTHLPIMRAEAALTGVIGVLPVALIFLLSQRLIVRGATAGAIKE